MSMLESPLTKEELGKKIMQVAYKMGDFTLSSGKKSDYIFDKYAFETRPELLNAITAHIAEMVHPGTKKLAGMEIGGIPLVTALSIRTGLPFVIIRKAAKGHGITRQMEGQLSKGDRVALIEDVVTTGGQSLVGVDVLRSAGAVVEDVICVIDREEGGRENIEARDLVFNALFTKSALTV
ncbi:MAG: orotate phosphoribosyltransferase [Planctomycetes bacterium]|nr:orotate phosphoribosyltransferase [Planctomycetota bacterium]